MKKSSFLLALSASILTTTTLAGTMGSLKTPQTDLPWLGSLSTGPVWERGGQSQSFYLNPGIEKTYAAQKSTKTLAHTELFIGVQKKLFQTLQSQLGFAAAASSSAGLDGYIWDNASPELNHYTYSYKIQHTHVAFKTKLLVGETYWLIPWFSASLGLAFNNAHSFTNTPIVLETPPNANFSSNTQTSFTYTLGAGLQKAFNKHWHVGLGYEFADWGKSRLGAAKKETLNEGPKLNHLYTHGLLANLTYVA